MLIRNKKICIKITPGFTVLLAILFYLDDGSGMMGWCCIAALLHELGHVLMCLTFGGRVEALSLSLVGAEMKLSYPAVLSYVRENLVLLSGAVANLLTGILSYCFGLCWLAIVSFGLGAFNLLPIVPLDGGRILSNLISERHDPEYADRIVRVISGIFVGVLAGVGCIAAAKHANVLLLALSVWLLMGILKKNHNFSPN